MKIERYLYVSHEGHTRSARFDIVLPNGDKTYAVNICQIYQFSSMTDFTMQEPTLGWSLWQSQTDPELVRLIAAAFQQGADLLEKWSWDTGKPSKEVLT